MPSSLLHRFLLSLSLLWAANARAETPEDFFHGGAMFYLSNNIPQALQVVTNGLQQFPNDEKLKKLHELLNQQQNQQQQQQQQQQPQQQQEQKQDQQQQPKPSPQEQKEQESKSGEKKPEPQPQDQAHAMTPEEAKQLLDGEKGNEQVLQFRPPDKPKERKGPLKDW